ncbi:MAG: glycosyltransferase family 39 protein [Anaerolineales bacterium]|nr:glycosyltransferase family 39 protein [Anaerolineales bacterium]
MYPFVCFCLLLGLCWWSLDSGFHWDEGIQIELVQQTLQSGSLLPSWYNYPSMSYWLSLTSLLPHLPTAMTPPPLTDYLLDVSTRPRFFMQVKFVFLLVSCLTVFWVYTAVRLTGRTPLEAAVAPAMLIGSWEMGYHMRWIAPDGILMQWGALWLLCMVAASQQKRLRWAYGAAAVAGLACGTKYPGGLLLIPTLGWIVWYLWEKRPSLWTSGCVLFTAALIAAAAYLLSTPGTLLQWPTFLSNVQYELNHYQQGHYGHTITAGWPHLKQMIIYLTAVQLAPYRPLALFLSSLAMIGLGWLWRYQQATAVATVSFPVLYIAYFAMQNVMIVRNLLVLLPFGVWLTALGVLAVYDWLPQKRYQSLWVLLLAGVIGINWYWLGYSSFTIKERLTNRFTAEAVAYLSQQADMVWLSPAVADALHRPQGNGPTAVIYAHELFPQPTDWPANNPDLYDRQFGPFEVNFAYYPSWIGNERLLILTAPQQQWLCQMATTQLLLSLPACVN